ncbi:VWA domain-containing protein [Rhizobium jaguaris]|uniref:VWA domain-containing protein n=1 Tax=Rhizobium jaguaris TaxID=1312183 RepID=UPI0039BFAAE4
MSADFHFMRPWLLLSLVLPVAVLWLSSRSGDVRNQWKVIIAPHLLDRLVVDVTGGPSIRPSWVLAGILTVGILAAAGPAWERERPPFVEDTAPLIIAVDLSPTMDAIDVTPSRLERAKLKIHDVIASRNGARTGIIAYAGSAHLVLPLTEDASLIETYIDALATRIMPVSGKDTAKALKLAEDMLAQERATGTILFITDGVEQTAFEAFKQNTGSGIVVLGVGTAEGGPVKTPDKGFLSEGGNRLLAKLDVEGLQNLHRLTGADVATATADDTDIRWVSQRIRSNFAEKKATEGDRWRDMGWWLVVPVVVALALSFRRGWVVRTGVFLLALRLLSPGDAGAAEFTDMWLTPDQQGRMAFERGDFAGAASHFSDLMWRGVSFYRAGKFADAVDAFASIDTAESWYDQGNAFLHLSRFEEAVAAFGKALDKRKDWPDAQANLVIAERLLEAQKDKEREAQQDPNEKPDSVQFDDKGKKGKEGQIDIAEQTSEMWMNNLQVSPADLMARKFSLEIQKRKP